MSVAIDHKGIGPENLVDALDRFEPSTDDSIPPISVVRSLATAVDVSEGSEESTIKSAIEEIERLLAYDRAWESISSQP